MASRKVVILGVELTPAEYQAIKKIVSRDRYVGNAGSFELTELSISFRVIKTEEKK